MRHVRLLARTFFDRMFESDLFSSSVSASTAVMWMLAALATPGVMFSGSQYYFYAHARTFSPQVQDRILFVSQAFHVDFVMAIAGVVTMLVWTSLAPDRRDALVLGPLPVTPREQALARLLALSRFFALFAAAVTLPTAVVFTFVTVGNATLTELLARIAGHIAGTTLGAAFVFFVLIDLQLLLAATLGPRAVAIVTWPLQGAAVLAIIAALAMTGHLADALLDPATAGSVSIMWNPAAWFVGIYRWMAGDAREMFALLAARGVVGAVLAFAVACVAYPFAYEKCLEKAIATEGRRAAWWSGAATRIWLSALSPLLRTPLERGLAAFIVANLTRSHAHRFLVGSYLGIGLLCALPLASRLVQAADVSSVQYAWLSVPLGLLWWSAAALRVAMMLPVEPASNWIFKLTEPVDKARVLSTTVAVIFGATAAPLALAFGMAAALAISLAFGATVFALVLITGATLSELLTLTMRIIPGTCTYRPGQLRLRVLWPVYLGLWTLIAYVLPRIAVATMADVTAFTVLLGTLAATWWTLRAWRLTRAHRLKRLIYEEAEPTAATTINLSSA